MMGRIGEQNAALGEGEIVFSPSVLVGEGVKDYLPTSSGCVAGDSA
jgi:hypothetical protein